MLRCHGNCTRFQPNRRIVPSLLFAVYGTGSRRVLATLSPRTRTCPPPALLPRSCRALTASFRRARSVAAPFPTQHITQFLPRLTTPSPLPLFLFPTLHEHHHHRERARRRLARPRGLLGVMAAARHGQMRPRRSSRSCQASTTPSFVVYTFLLKRFVSGGPRRLILLPVCDANSIGPRNLWYMLTFYRRCSPNLSHASPPSPFVPHSDFIVVPPHLRHQRAAPSASSTTSRRLVLVQRSRSHSVTGNSRRGQWNENESR